MAELKEILNSITRIDSYQRVDDSHPLDLYIGVDELSHWTLLLVCDVRPQQLSSSKMIKAKIGQRKDGRWTVSLSLIKDEYKDMFILFCGDIISSSRVIGNKNKASGFVIRRYKEWKDMLANSSTDLLTPEEIKGLLGEMYILDRELIKKYGPEESAISWTGPQAVHQDFIINDTWYEVKTISSSKNEVKISSVEQLDCKTDGHLVIVFADKTSKTNMKALNLNGIYMKLLAQITDDDVRDKFCSMLLHYGYYPRPEYENEEYMFEVKNVQHYLVNERFPCFRRVNIPAEITGVNYTISLPAIQSYREKM